MFTEAGSHNILIVTSMNCNVISVLALASDEFASSVYRVPDEC